jgi:hypothetical protein
MKRWVFATIVALVVAAPLAFADKPRRGLQKYEEDTSEVKDLSKKPSKVKTWVEIEEEPDSEFKFPWIQLGGALLCFALAAPFAWRLYRNVNDEIASTKDEKDLGAAPRVRRKLTGERSTGG